MVKFIFIILFVIQISNAFADSGKVYGDLRTFYFDGQRELRTDRVSLSIGGIFGYETATYNGFSIGGAFYSSHNVAGISKMPESGQTQNLQSSGDSIDVLGELYIKYKINNTVIKLGRQRLNFPTVNDYYNRMLPNSFEALYLENKSFDLITLKAAYITRWKYKNTQQFTYITDYFNIDNPITIAGAIININKYLNLSIYDTYIPELINSPYIEIKSKNLFNFPKYIKTDVDIQYLKQKSINGSILQDINSYLFGVRLNMQYSKFYISALYTQIGKQTLVGSGSGYEKNGWAKFLTYTDIQIDAETENAGAKAYGGTIKYKFSDDYYAAFKYIHVNQDDNLQSNPYSLTSNPRPDSNEYNIDMLYKPNKDLKLRLRIAKLNYLTSSTEIYKNKAFDELNTRFIIDYGFNLAN